MSLHTYKLIKSNIIMPLHLKHAISIPIQTQNSPFIQHFLLIICEITTHTPLKYCILYLKHDNTQCKVYHSMPLHTYTANFATSSNLQETIYKHISNSPFTHLFLLIICELTMHIHVYATHATQTSYFVPKT